MVITSVILPVMLAAPTTDVMRVMFLCFASAAILNVYFVLTESPEIAIYLTAHGSAPVEIGYSGYFGGKNTLGELAALVLLLSLHEALQRGWRRALGLIVAVVAAWLIVKAESKTAFALAFVCPPLAWLTVLVRRVTRLSPAIILSTIPICWVLASQVSSFGFSRVSYILYGEPTLTGRTIIWDFAQSEIARKPLFGWGYQSFWLVPNSPALTEAPGFVRIMPMAHNGYYDTILEMGYAGLAFLLVFIFATLHAVGPVADRDPARARLIFSVAFYFVLFNFLESMWMRAFEFLWVAFMIIAAEAARYWQPFPLRGAAYHSTRQKTG